MRDYCSDNFSVPRFHKSEAIGEETKRPVCRLTNEPQQTLNLFYEKKCLCCIPDT